MSPNPYGVPMQQHAHNGYGQYSHGILHPYQTYSCSHCKWSGHVSLWHRAKKISVAGWVTFGLLLVFFFPLFWIGLLMKDEKYQCPNCWTVT